jgi:hypothetical protein
VTRQRPSGNLPRPRGAHLGELTVCVGCALGLLTGEAHSQRAYCNLTEVTVERLSNAVVLNFVSDGLLDAEGPWQEYVDPQHDWEPRQITRVPFVFRNARLRTSSFINVAVYPVSHVELSPVPGATQGIGVEVTLVLYRPGRVSNLEFTNWDNNFAEGHARRGITYDLHLDKGRKTLVAVITSDRNVVMEPNLRRPERLAAGPTSLTVSGSAAAVDVHALNVGLRRLLTELSTVGGLRFAVEGDVERLVSLTVTRTPPDELLQALVSTYGLSVRTEGGVHFLTEASLDKLTAYGQAAAALVPLNYLEAGEAIHLLPECVLPYLHVDPDHNAVAVSGPPWLVEKVRSDLTEIDVRPEFIELELRALETKSTALDGVGLNARYQVGNSEWDADAEEGTLSFRAAGPLDKDCDLRLQALERAGRARTAAHVREVVISGRTCELFAGQVQYVRVLRSRGGRMEPELLPVNVGVQFTARPVSGGDRAPIQIWLEGKVSNVVGEDPDTHMPELSARTVRTELQVADGDTLVLALSTVHQADRGRRSSSVLGQVSFTDSLFRTRRDQQERTELFLLLTARTVTGRPGLDLKALLPDLRRGAGSVGASAAPLVPMATAGPGGPGARP